MIRHTFALLALTLVAAPALGQDYVPPRTPDGRPDLQGVWTNTTMTPLERADPSLPLELSEEQAARIEDRRAGENATLNAPTPFDEVPVGGTSVGYNLFWIERGDRLARVDGVARSSWITEPADGRMPLSADGRARIAAIEVSAMNASGPESLTPADRCLIGSRGSGGPPMLNNIYNNFYQIVQTPDHVMILVEMMHDARIVRIGEGHKPDELDQWLGDSVGRWSGDTLIVETRNWKPAQGDYGPIYLSGEAYVTETFERISENELLYRFEVDDPATYTDPWRGEMVFNAADGAVHEFACHEGNYAMTGILSGARVEEGREESE